MVVVISPAPTEERNDDHDHRVTRVEQQFVALLDRRVASPELSA
jgi:hypothetical protein